MPVTLNITAEDAEELVIEFRRLNELTTTGNIIKLDAVLASMPINDFMDIANKKLRPQGFKIVVDEPPIIAEASAPEPEPEPESKPKKAKAKAEPDAPSNVEDFPTPRRSKNSGAVDPIDALKNLADQIDALKDSDPEGDRQFVLDTLAGMLKNSPKKKDKVLEFTGRQAQLHGAEKISALPAEPFPSIRREMEKAFPDVRLA